LLEFLIRKELKVAKIWESRETVGHRLAARFLIDESVVQCLGCWANEIGQDRQVPLVKGGLGRLVQSDHSSYVGAQCQRNCDATPETFPESGVIFEVRCRVHVDQGFVAVGHRADHTFSKTAADLIE
jgi:hypothetical protein